MTPKNPKKCISTSSALLASALLAAPVVLTIAQNAAAQTPTTATTAAGEGNKLDAGKPNTPNKTSYLKHIDQCCVEIVGVDTNGNGILKGSDGKEFSYAGSGEKIYYKQFVKGTSAVQPSNARQNSNYIKATKELTNIEVVGINSSQKTVYKNKAGETFTLHPTTGDMVFIK